MSKRSGIEERFVAAAALAGRNRGVSLGGKTRELAEKHTSEQLREMSTSEAPAEAGRKKRGRKAVGVKLDLLLRDQPVAGCPRTGTHSGNHPFPCRNPTLSRLVPFSQGKGGSNDDEGRQTS
jgi:hypothetical protein